MLFVNSDSFRSFPNSGSNHSMTLFNCFPGGLRFAVTMSYDDGHLHDERLISIFNQHGIKGTFHLNSGLMETPDRISAADAARIYKGHEIACHTVSHPFPDELSKADLIREVIQDRMNLEKITGGIVRGMSYPYGRFNDSVIAAMTACEIAYSRTTIAHNGFAMPQNFMTWNPTCHHKNAQEPVERFLSMMASDRARWTGMSLLYIWGHAFEFAREGNWELIENLCSKLGGIAGVWYATNIEIYHYEQARRSLQASADGRRIHNPSSFSVWISVDGKPLEVLPGTTVEV